MLIGILLSTYCLTFVVGREMVVEKFCNYFEVSNFFVVMDNLINLFI